MPRTHTLLLVALVALLPARAQVVDNPARRGEFPMLSMLPPGSVVDGISMPRYENRRVTAHIMADKMEVLSPERVRFTGINSKMYNNAGEETSLKLRTAEYSFATEMMDSHSDVCVENPRFRATGAAVAYSNECQKGLVRGPVNTTFNTEALLADPPSKKQLP